MTKVIVAFRKFANAPQKRPVLVRDLIIVKGKIIPVEELQFHSLMLVS